jgi:hypothetical protein
MARPSAKPRKQILVSRSRPGQTDVESGFEPRKRTDAPKIDGKRVSQWERQNGIEAFVSRDEVREFHNRAQWGMKLNLDAAQIEWPEAMQAFSQA